MHKFLLHALTTGVAVLAIPFGALAANTATPTPAPGAFTPAAGVFVPAPGVSSPPPLPYPAIHRHHHHHHRHHHHHHRHHHHRF